MASEIEEIVEINDNPHNDNTKKNENNDSVHSNGDINGNSDHDRVEDKKEDGRKFPLRDCCSSSSPIAPDQIEEIFDFNDNTKKKNDSFADRAEDKKEDGRKDTSTRVLCYPLRPVRSIITTLREKSNRKKKDKEVNIKSEHRGDNDANPPKQQMCLSSSIFFQENAVVKKRLLCWWIEEGFLDSLKTKGKTLEIGATEILDKFMEQCFILPVKKNCHKVVNSFKMHPVVHSRMMLAKEAKSLDSISDAFREWFQDEVYFLTNSGPLQPENQEKVTTLFNISKGSLDFRLEAFPKMKNVKVLHLGRWQSSAEGHHIEVANSELLKGLKVMENLRFLSLQGISGIQELPDRSISSLRNLRILDLRACYNLEKLPKEIASLKKLTHLDTSECYLLDCMPRELLSLSELQVLKGFVITDTKNSNSCTLAELEGLEKLTKLSVNLNSVNFSIDNFSAVLKLDKLKKLKITWGGKFSNVHRNKKSKQENGQAKSKATEDDIKISLTRLKSAVGEVNLEKLELQCLPHKTLPNWVNPDILKKLKKLYIRGGGLKTLSGIQVGNQKWEVEALRLKYLNEFNMNWIELKEQLFPDLQYFEKFKCPKLTLCPCDCTGVWVKSSTKESPPLPHTTS
ncbi:hypothetical protein LWI29_016902 [Acer saccharum]|uniref:Disease resistance RPP13-like protein 4 n=1 Tax=Acer saccharum TaxID=4024 RepID=A0AA39SLM3_ACESA|nr:hypothetical protein LWI29_016902 [Acer saccharum]